MIFSLLADMPVRMGVGEYVCVCVCRGVRAVCSSRYLLFDVVELILIFIRFLLTNFYSIFFSPLVLLYRFGVIRGADRITNGGKRRGKPTKIIAQW